jgi:hypothetical protein
MISFFSRAMDQQVDRQFRKDPSGRLVFLPFGSKGKAYFVDSKSDEEKIRSFVKMYRSASAAISLVSFPSIYVPSSILNLYVGAIPLRNKLEAIAGIGLFFMLILLALVWMLWGIYKETVAGLTASLTEVGPDLKGQLSEISPIQRNRQRLALTCLFVSTILLGIAILGTTHYYRAKVACPPKGTVTSR